MPVFVQWKWIEKTKTLLTIFHFFDDYEKPNLRLMKMGGDIRTFLHSPKRDMKLKKNWISWAPSHLEMALLMQLLSHANIINGLKPSEKKELWFELEGREDMYPYEEDFSKFAEPHIVGERIGGNTRVIQYIDRREDAEGFLPVYTCVELCQEYIDFVWNKLRRYLKD